MKKNILLLFSLYSSLIIGQSIQSINPNSGMQGQLLTISITGQNTTFQQGTNVIKLVQNGTGTMISPSSTNFISSTLIDATFPLSIHQTTGIYDLVIDHYLMSSMLTLANSFTLNVNPNSPSLSSISPASGKQGDTVMVTIYGTNTNFSSGLNTISISNGSYVVNSSSITVTNNTTVQAEFIFNNAASVGDYDIHLSNSLDGAMLLSNAFRLNIGAHPAMIKSINPNSGMQGQLLTISISGQNTVFKQATNAINIKLIQGGTAISPSITNFIHDSLIDATFAFNTSHPLGLYDVMIDKYLTNSTLILSNGFTLNTNPNTSSLSSVSPTSGSQGNTVTITINGVNTNFNSVPNTIEVKNGSYSINPSMITVINNSTIQAKFNFSYSHPIGNYNIHVTNSLDGSMVLNSAFDLLAGTHPPQLVSISPNNAMHGQTLTVSITGQSTNFNQATSIINLIQGSTYITPINYTVINDTLVNANFTFTTSHPVGLYTVRVGSYSLLNAFTLYSKIVSVSPASAKQGDTVIITITGINSNFGSTTDTDSVWLKSIYGGKLLYPTSITVVNTTTIKAKFIFKNFPFTGLYSVYVKNNIDGTNQIKNAFTLIADINSPAITNVTPNYAWLNYLPVTMTITGKNTHFKQGLDTVRLANETASIYPISINIKNDTLIIANFAPISIMVFPQPFYLDVLVEGHENAILKDGFQIHIPVDVPEMQTDEIIALFPNPTSGLINLTFNKAIDAAQLIITDVQGKTIYHQNQIQSKSIQIDLSGYEKGIYILNVSNENLHILKKIALLNNETH